LSEDSDLEKIRAKKLQDMQQQAIEEQKREQVQDVIRFSRWN